MPNYKPPVVISAHGIRTHGHWQTTLSEILNQHDMKFKSYKYGYFGLHKFALNHFREKMIEHFYEFYNSLVDNKNYDIDSNNYTKRPSVVAHSFGTYIIGNCLLKYEDIKLDKLILCGSILPQDFDWSVIIARDQINCIRNEYGLKDVWTKLVKYVVRNTGDSGYNGFDYFSNLVIQEQFDYFKHSDCFNKSHIESHWIPFLTTKPSSLFVRHGRDIIDEKEYDHIFDISYKLDATCFGELRHYSDIDLPLDIVYKWISVNPDIYTFLFCRDCNELKGYINAMPVDDELFKSIYDGDIGDNEVQSKNLLPYIKHQSIKIYLMSIAIDPKTRKINQGLFQEAFEKLLNAFINKLIYYAIYQKIKVTDFISIAWTDEGNRLCKLFQMDKVGTDKYGNNVYHIKLEPKVIVHKHKVLPGIKKLCEIYNTFE